ncbi:hypothetical protein PFICI_00190 [Pestalotiopsis fici W106-1]|uniref:Zn(2)-C6 fungal-type domain-containing protein n=1 Tax=Pestalotiopsis fici (strain W106-1 / CGMCC3.15140) TaxID=1229662 RepID=W3XLM5_PESFW|nr:uncharacterized protein PFICI_00190 [Pestalotiopsis fici W106-1]ETS86362.1 hypothetical protein PFICI_00190 [Pestalotiopsis fici W106-1]
MNAANKKKRRTHYKSRKGCSECKKRHVKCDEQRPICLQCSTLGQPCSYAYLDPYGGGSSSLNAGTLSQSPSPLAATESPPQSLPGVGPQIESSIPAQAPKQVFELSHLALLHHVETGLTKPPHSHLVTDEKDADALVRLMVTSALSSPFLMDELLAFAAAHLSVLTPEPLVQDQYRDQAAHLQARALALFNAAGTPEITEHNSTAMFLFSSIIGMHMLFDIVTAQTDLQDLLERFIHFAGIYRGVGIVTGPAWHIIRASELSCIINLIETVDKLNLPAENTCDDLIARLALTEERLGPLSYRACHDAVQILQWIFKQHCALPTPINRQVVLAWPVRISQDFLDLLRNRQPEALVIMAYWAILLHRGREFWVFGQGGRSLFDAIDGFLGPAWSEWLSFPRAIICLD